MLKTKFLSTPQPNKIKILITSDIHLALEKVEALGEWMMTGGGGSNNNTNKREGIDFVLCCGDLTDLDPKNNEIPELMNACVGEMSAVISCLERVYPKVMYIPGNHDAKTTLAVEETRPRLTTHSINLHHRVLRLTPDLVIVGLGGSVPGYRGDEQIWKGYPYTDEQLIEEHLSNLLKQPFTTKSTNDDVISVNDTIVLVTHVGPYSISTTIDQTDLDSEPIFAGSHALKKILLDPVLQRKILINIHGHTHHATGMARLGKIYVMNPGSLRTGHFGIVSLKKKLENKWQISSSEFHRL